MKAKYFKNSISILLSLILSITISIFGNVNQSLAACDQTITSCETPVNTGGTSGAQPPSPPIPKPAPTKNPAAPKPASKPAAKPASDKPADAPADSPQKTTTPVKIDKFSVRTYLTVGTTDAKKKGAVGIQGDQKQSYLDSSNPAASFILQIINFLVLTVGSLCFVAIVYGGFMILASSGNAGNVTKGKDVIMHAVVGLVITLSAFFIITFVQYIFYETIK